MPEHEKKRTGDYNEGSKQFVRMTDAAVVVASPGIEPGSGASETLILSIVLQGLN